MYCRFPKKHAEVRIFCFPWAGGGSSFYSEIAKLLEDEAELHAYCLPGREHRFKDPPNHTFKEVLDDIVTTIHEKFDDKPFIFYGHSMGGLISFFVARRLRELYGKQPDHMIVSGAMAPHSKQRPFFNPEGKTYQQMIDYLITRGGTPPELLENQELMELIMPALKADLATVLDMRYNHDPDAPPPLTCQIDYFDGEEDIDHDLPAWRQVTSGPFTYRKLPGGHFFLRDPENTKKIAQHINLWSTAYHNIV